jgi:hypothetical protein
MGYISNMPTVHFSGKILPAVVEISMDSIPELDWVEIPINLKMHFTISIVKSTVDVKIDCNIYRQEDFGQLYNRAFDLARGCVDTLAFATGYGLTVYFESFTAPDETVNPFFGQNPALAAYCTFFKYPIVTQDDRLALNGALKIVLSEPPIFMALNDLIQANTVPHLVPVNCGRVLDGLRKLVVPGVDPKQGWPTFQTTVNADGAYLVYISDHSKNPRHGDREFISGTIASEVLKRTWIIMNRFLEYRKRGNQPLPLAEFPLLQG